MADLAGALPGVLRHEGLYSNDPADAGGETFMGISRYYHPGWEGWADVSSWVADGRKPEEVSSELAQKVARFYFAEYWDRFGGEHVPDQTLANLMLLIAVHLGVHRTVEFTQRALNALNLGGTRWADLALDGRAGPRTRAAITQACAIPQILHSLRGLLISQHMVYCLQRVEERPANEKYTGWFTRLASWEG